MSSSSPQRPVVAAYYFPNYHPNDDNSKVHGPGWTEWELMKQAGPRFPGHRQPLIPAWGYEDEADPKVMEKKIAAAVSHGVDCFLFDWYYYEDGPLFERCLEEGFLKSKNVGDITFACMWANHDWGDIHPMKRGVQLPMQHKVGVTGGHFEKFTDIVIERYFSHPSHLKVDGAPFFSIYHLGLLVKSFGSFAETRKALDGFRERTVRAGFPDLHLNAIGSLGAVLTGEDTKISTYQAAADLGFDSINNYCWAHFAPMRDPEPTVDYAKVCDSYFSQIGELRGKYPSLPHFPNVSMGWDATPRIVQSDVWDPTLGYPFTQILGNNTPANFERALALAKKFLEDRKGFSMVSLNAWNEWTEGSYLEPDTVNGMGYLEAVRNVFGPYRP